VNGRRSVDIPSPAFSRYDPGMSEAIVAVLGVAFAAFCIWLTVRIVNRRERWAKRTAVALVALLGYPLSIGPFVFLRFHGYMSDQTWNAMVSSVYWPLEKCLQLGPALIADAFRSYLMFWREL